MEYELDVLAALIYLPEPTTQSIAAATDISTRKVQIVLKALQLNLNIEIEKIKCGRNIHYRITNWGVFESGTLLKQSLSKRLSAKNKKHNIENKIIAYYDSIKLRNFQESSRLEGISIQIKHIRIDKKHISTAKHKLIKKYSTYMGNISS